MSAVPQPSLDERLAEAHLRALERRGAVSYGRLIDVTRVARYDLDHVRKVAHDLQVIRDRIAQERR